MNPRRRRPARKKPPHAAPPKRGTEIPAPTAPHRAQPKPAEGKQTHWGEVADWYDKLVGEEGSEYHRHVVFPGVLKLLAPRSSDHVLDVACGQGAFCRLLNSKGIRATGVDAAAELIHHARQRNQVGAASAAATGTKAAPDATAAALSPPDYHIADARNLLFLPENNFTAATCILAIQNIDQLPPVFSGIHRALAAGGRFILVMMHPAFRGPKYTHWGWDDGQKVQYRRVDRYLLPRKDRGIL